MEKMRDTVKDMPALFKAFVVPYLAVYFGSCVGFLLVTGQDIPQVLWVLFVGALGELGIELGARKALGLAKRVLSK